ncbi:MFS transporter [Paralcaligenes ureilyticus]|uniref:Sugar phosphate permease n=1 Tax=Paralcaligenes ureilyticus TaxID=627131 RepID=A0A4R3LVM8_9BURK|nr:MFS transporter [Paralcaligenes ureilyticus]TCT02507.1 sugar phosphate permease [Paralcaligenes ureilyticus]
MFAQPLSNWLRRHGIHFAWVIAFICFLTMLTSSAALGLPGVLLQPLGKEYGWDTEQISSALALRFALYGLMGPFAAILMDRYGLRKVICAALVLVTAGMALATRMTALWQLVVLWGVVLGFGSGLTALVLGAVVANRWFEARRGLVIGMLTASTATGQLVFLPGAAWLIENFGWRAAIFPVCLCALLVIILAVCFMRDHPEDLGLTAYGAIPSAAAAAPGSGMRPSTMTGTRPVATTPAPRTRLSIGDPFRMLGHVRGNQTFWILFATFFICGLSTNGLIQTHFVSLCGDFGLSAVPAASVLAMMGAFDFFGTILSGWLSDRYDNRKLLFWYYSLRGLSLLWLPHSEFTFYGLSIFAMFYGLDWVATVPPTVRLAGNAFGKERAGMVFGWIFAGHQLGAATAAYGAGAARTLLLSYTPALYVAGGACLIAALIVLGIRRVHY